MTIHIAGLDIHVGTHVRQRCAWCGEILDDRDLANEKVAVEIPKPPPGADPVAWTKSYQTEAPVVRGYPVGELIEVTGTSSGAGRMVAVVAHQDGDPLPPDCCAQTDD